MHVLLSFIQFSVAGLSMELVESNSSGQHFVFVHNKEYQKVQFQFLDAVESLNPQTIIVSDILPLNSMLFCFPRWCFFYGSINCCGADKHPFLGAVHCMHFPQFPHSYKSMQNKIILKFNGKICSWEKTVFHILHYRDE